MRAVLVDVPEGLLEERRRKNHDVWDEMWGGVLHIVSPPSSIHQRFGTELLVALAPLVKARGLVAFYETGLFRPGVGDVDYRVPDLLVARRENVVHKGVEGRAELVVELLSPGDETYDKLDFYADLDVQEVLIIDPESCQVELFAMTGQSLDAVAPEATGSLTARSLGVTLTPVAGPVLHLIWVGGDADITGRT
jgi:Uma2 family endonuclease